MLDCLKPISHKKLIEKELEGFGIRLNKRPPGITFRRKDKGGVSLTTTISEPKLDLDCKFRFLLLHCCCIYAMHKLWPASNTGVVPPNCSSGKDWSPLRLCLLVKCWQMIRAASESLDGGLGACESLGWGLGGLNGDS